MKNKYFNNLEICSFCLTAERTTLIKNVVNGNKVNVCEHCYKDVWGVPMNETKFYLKYCGIEESDTMDTTDMTQEEIEKELVQWVLDRVDHWSQEVKK